MDKAFEKRLEDLEDEIDREEIMKVLAEPLDPMPYEEFRKELGLE